MLTPTARRFFRADRPSSRDAASLRERRAQYLIRTVFQLVATLIFPVGWVGDPRLQVFAAPVPFSPPPETIVRTGKRRRALQKVKPGVYFMMLAALVLSLIHI